MPPPTDGPRPQPGERGLASSPLDDVSALVGGAWDAAIGIVATVDLDAPTRLAGWSARHVLVHLGSWEEPSPADERADDARTGRVRSDDDAGARNAMVVTAHHDADADEIRTALRSARDRALALLGDDDAEVLGRRWVGSMVGQLPMTGVLVAQAYELAVHALDLAPTGLARSQVPVQLLDAGIGALVDVTGALAARHDLDERLAVVTPTACWATSAESGAWTTLRLEPGIRAHDMGWPGVAGSAADVLDAAAGRALAVQLLATRRLRVHDVRALVRLLPALQSAPGFPGGSALQATLQALGQTGRLAGRLGAGLTGLVARQPR